jgi:hypothetical protein
VTDDGTSLAQVTTDTRATLHFNLPSPPPSRLLLRALGTFASTNTNPRTLCFRVFRIEHGPEAKISSETAQVTLETPSTGSRFLTWWRNLQYVIAKLANEGPLVSLTIPVSPKLQRILKNYVDRGGLTGMLRGKSNPTATAPAKPIPSHPTIEPAAVDPPVRVARSIPCPDFLHTNGCGDFTLLSREKWFDLRGYPEWDIFSMNIDSVFCFTAHYGGATEEVLADPMRIYHIEHGSGSGWTPEGQKSLFDRISAKGIPILDNEDVLRWGAQMRRLKAPMIFSHENWGLSDVSFDETVPRPQQPLGVELDPAVPMRRPASI